MLRGPTLTMWPAPFQNPIGQPIGGAAPGGGLLPGPIGPMAPPAGAPLALGGVDVNAALAGLLAVPGVAAAIGDYTTQLSGD